MTKDERLSYVGLLALGVLFFVWIGPTQIKAEAAGSGISPRTVPYVYAGLIMVLAAFGLIRSMRTEADGWAISKQQFARLVVVIVAISLSAWLAGVDWMDRQVRFWVASIPTVLVGLWLTDVRNPRFIVLYTAGLIGSTWVLVRLTGIQLR